MPCESDVRTVAVCPGNSDVVDSRKRVSPSVGISQSFLVVVGGKETVQYSRSIVRLHQGGKDSNDSLFVCIRKTDCLVRFYGLVESFFKNDEGHNVTVNGDRYRAMITNFFIPELNNHDVQELWFQQDVATCHTARATIDLLKDTFGDHLIPRFEPVNWPPRSCDLTPLDYFLWGYVKSLVYADKPQTLDHLEDNIRRVIADIRPQMLEKLIENWTSRLDYI
ncbi:uncharacterized protein TNCV_466921 [Trichonephila clavipes]|nr:uncharacterized protein TNCV_466921 [Trichonephila clavipes]